MTRLFFILWIDERTLETTFPSSRLGKPKLVNLTNYPALAWQALAIEFWSCSFWILLKNTKYFLEFQMSLLSAWQAEANNLFWSFGGGFLDLSCLIVSLPLGLANQCRWAYPVNDNGWIWPTLVLGQNLNLNIFA